jgi:hypothetical protein
LARSIRSEAYCGIFYKPPNAQAGKVVLWQDFFDGPVMLLASTNANIILCLYDFDVDVRLFRIDTSQPFRALSQGSSINRILFFSNWDIRYGKASDWDELEQFLNSASDSRVARQLIHSGRFVISSRAKVFGALKQKNMYPDQ